jgi:hypothetical protein
MTRMLITPDSVLQGGTVSFPISIHGCVCVVFWITARVAVPAPIPLRVG